MRCVPAGRGKFCHPHSGDPGFVTGATLLRPGGLPGGRVGTTGAGSPTLDPDAGPWTGGFSFPSTRGMLFTGLPRAKDVWIRLRVQGTNGPSGWSDPATILVA